MQKQISPIQLHFWPTPNGRKVAIMLEELGVPYDVNLVNIRKGDQFKPEFLEISPNNRIPAIVDPEGPDSKPISVFESAAILKYLGEKFDQFYPKDWRTRVAVDEWLMWQVGGFGPMLGQNHHFANYAPEKIPYAIERFVKETNRLYGVLDQRLDGRDYVADEYSIADMAMIGWSLFHRGQGVNIAEFKHIVAWQQRLLERPGVQKGLALGKEEHEKDHQASDKAALKIRFKPK